MYWLDRVVISDIRLGTLEIRKLTSPRQCTMNVKLLVLGALLALTEPLQGGTLRALQLAIDPGF